MSGKFFSKQSPARLIALGFAFLIAVGSVLLMLPFSIEKGVSVSYIDILYTTTSAVCVTGLGTIDAGDTFTPIGEFILGTLIQIGGLGVTSVGAGIIVAMGKKLNIKSRTLVREGSNLSSGKGIIHFIRDVFTMTIVIELTGALLSFFTFAQDYPPLRAAGISIFHAVSAFNNAGFDIMGGFNGLVPYQSNLYLNLVTCCLIFLGGIGFLVIREVLDKRFKWKKFSMHTKIVLSMSLILTLAGTLLLKLTEDITWLGAFFSSVTARTAGFSTFAFGSFTKAGLIVMMVLMFIGASPGSTGSGIKTSTFYALIQGVKAAATNASEKAFHYSIPKGTFRKAGVIALIGFAVIFTGTYLFLIFDPWLDLSDAMFEAVSAFATVGISTGISPILSLGSKIVTIIMMFIGRLGPLTIASLWYFTKGERAEFPDGNIAIG